MTNTMTPSEIAEWLEIEADTLSHFAGLAGDAPHLRQAAATIRELEASLRDAEGDMNVARYELDEVSVAIGTVRFMDPPDGGSVTLAEQVARMHEALNAAEAKLKIATEALEAAEDKHLRGLFNMAVEEIDRVHELRRQALARIKEVG